MGRHEDGGFSRPYDHVVGQRGCCASDFDILIWLTVSIKPKLGSRFSLLMISLLTVAVPSPDEMCVPCFAYWSSSPRYRMEVMSHVLELTVNLSGLADPASTMMLLPDVVTPKAARAEEANIVAASNAL